jgi:hypothetical protein
MKIQGYSDAHDLKAILQSAYGAGQRVKLANNHSIAIYDKPTSLFGRVVNWLREVTGRNRRDHAQVVQAFQRLVDLEPGIERVRSSQTESSMPTVKLAERNAQVSDASDRSEIASETTVGETSAKTSAAGPSSTILVQALQDIAEDVEPLPAQDAAIPSPTPGEDNATQLDVPAAAGQRLTEQTQSVSDRPTHLASFAERQREISSARKFVGSLRDLRTADWDQEIEDYLLELSRLEKETIEPELLQDIDEVRALFDFKLGLSNSYRLSSQFVSKYKVASPTSLTRSATQTGENLQEVLQTLAPGKSFDEVHRQVKEFKSFCAQRATSAEKNAAAQALTQLAKGTGASIRIARDPYVLATKEELAVVSSVLADIEFLRTRQETDLGYMGREHALEQAEAIYKNHTEEGLTLNDAELEQVLESLAVMGSEAERVAALAVATEDLKKLETDFRSRVIELILKFQALTSN